MKRAAVFILLITVLLAACARSGYAAGDGRVTDRVSKSSFKSPIECSFNGQTVTVEAPKYTGLPVEAVYSYKKTLAFIDGYMIFEVATENGLLYYKVDKNGAVTATDTDFQSLKSKTSATDYLPVTDGGEIEIEGQTGQIIGNGVAKIQSGDLGNYTQYLYTTAGDRISEGYDNIGYFFNGLALTVKDKKVGLIDEKGNAVLEPIIPFDTVKYNPEAGTFYPVFMFEDAFVLPVGGEFAVVNIQR